MRAFRATPHTATKEAPNFLMFGRELHLLDQLAYGTPGDANIPVSQYTQDLVEHLDKAYQILREQQTTIRAQDTDCEPAFVAGGE